MPISFTPYGGSEESEALYVVGGTESDLDGRLVRAVVLMNPSDSSPYAADSGTTGSSLALHDSTTPSQGAAVTVAGALRVDTGDAPPATYTHVFTTTGTGTVQDGSANPPVAYALQVAGVGATPASWTVLLEVSIDNTNWVTALTHQSGTNANGAVVHTTAFPALYLRATVSGYSAGSASGLRVSFVGKS